jgi:hypothetical protein
MNCMRIFITLATVILAVYVPTDVNYASSDKSARFCILLSFGIEHVIKKLPTLTHYVSLIGDLFYKTLNYSFP